MDSHVSLDAKGAYLLLLELAVSAEVAFARRALNLEAGYYVYAGSAMGGLGRRLKHYLAPPQRRHWHIDRLREHAKLLEVWCAETATRRECHWAEAVAAHADALIPRFGCSDCRCRSHLFFFRHTPRPERVLPFEAREGLLLRLHSSALER